MKKDYKIVFIDMDGTLLDEDKKIPEENVAAIKELRKLGIPVVLASGKSTGSLAMLCEECKAGPYVVASNGAIVQNVETGEIIYSKDISKENASLIYDAGKTYQLYKYLNVGSLNLIEAEKFGMEPNNKRKLLLIEDIYEYTKTVNEPILKISYIDNNKEKLEELRNSLLNIQNVNVRTVGSATFVTYDTELERYPYYFDIVSENVTKAEAIEYLLEKLKIDKSEAVAIGDGENDLEMLGAVGLPVAMANATNELKDIAKFITLSNDEAGVAHALNKIFLQKDKKSVR